MAIKQPPRFIAYYTDGPDREKSEEVKSEDIYNDVKPEVKPGESTKPYIPTKQIAEVYRWWKDTWTGKISDTCQHCYITHKYINQRDKQRERLAFLDPETLEQIGLVAKEPFLDGRDCIGFKGKPYTVKVESEVAKLMGLSMTNTYGINSPIYKSSVLRKVFNKHQVIQDNKPQIVVNIENLTINK